MNSRREFLLWHWLVPTAVTLVVFTVLRLMKIDEYLAGQFFNGYNWPYRENWWLSELIHNAGHKIALAAYAALVLIMVYRWARNYSNAGIAYALTSIGLSVLAVNLCKTLLHFPCPWDALNNLGQFSAYAWLPKRAGCFPSGHASSGYAWLCFYYVARMYFPHLRTVLATLAMALGLCFGIAQQIRGAHFLSHDLICLYVCWMVASLMYFFWPSRPIQSVSSIPAKTVAQG